MVGLATDYCVLATALDARTRGYPTTVLAAGVRAVDLQPGDGEQALAELRVGGRVRGRGLTARGRARHGRARGH